MRDRYDAITESSTATYEIRIFDADRNELSLSETRTEGPDIIPASTLWEAAASLATIPEKAWMHWDDEDGLSSELVPVKRITLEHVRRGRNKRGHATHQGALLEIIDR